MSKPWASPEHLSIGGTNLALLSLAPTAHPGNATALEKLDLTGQEQITKMMKAWTSAARVIYSLWVCDSFAITIFSMVQSFEFQILKFVSRIVLRRAVAICRISELESLLWQDLPHVESSTIWLVYMISAGMWFWNLFFFQRYLQCICSDLGGTSPLSLPPWSGNICSFPLIYNMFKLGSLLWAAFLDVQTHPFDPCAIFDLELRTSSLMLGEALFSLRFPSTILTLNVKHLQHFATCQGCTL